MTTVKALEIHGIRSFGIERGDVQRIQFDGPLTLFVGQNGSGKTTIIECLKYAVTGECPPNSDKGKFFVHNIKMANATEAIGKVKLQVKDRKGDLTTIDRAIKVTTKNGKQSAETMACTVTFEPKGGKKVSLTRRVADATSEMCHAMGVSKAIINNVIFCHQEDSNWPLDESKKVKTKFDEIFGTTEYNKALDELRKKQKIREDDRKTKEAHLIVFQGKKEEADSKNEQLKKCESDIESKNVKIRAIESELKPVRDRKVDILQKEVKVSKIYEEEITLKTKLSENLKIQDVCKRKIKQIFPGEIEELKREIRSFQSKVAEARDDNESTDNEISVLKQIKNQIDRKIQEAEAEKVRLQQLLEQQQDKNSERAKHLEEITTKLSIATPSDLDNQNPRVIQGILTSVKTAVNTKDTNLKELKHNNEEADRTNQEKVDQSRDKKIKIESEIASKMEANKNMQREIQETQKTVNNIKAGATQLQEINDKISRLESEQRNIDSEQLFTEKETKISEMKIERDEIQQELDTVEEKIEQLNQISGILNEISYKEKQLVAHESEFKRIQNKQNSNLGRLFSERIESDFKRAVQRKYDELEREVKALKDGNTKQGNALTENKMKQRHLRDQITKIEKELKEGEEAIYDKCQGDDYEDLKAKVKEKLEKLRMELGANRSAESFYQKYIDEVNQQNCCPLCHKDVDVFAKDDLVTELSDKIRRLPDKISQQEIQIKRDEQKFNDLLKLEPTIQRVETLKNELPKMKTDLKTFEDKIKEIESNLEDNEISLTVPEANVSLANSMLADMSILDQRKSEIEKTQKELSTLKTKIPVNHANENLEEIKQRKKDLKEKLKAIIKEIEKEEQLFQKSQKQLQTIQEIRNKLLQNKVTLQEKAQQLPQLEERLQQLKIDVEQTRESIKTLNQNLQAAEKELNRVVEMKQQEKERNKKILDKAESEKTKIDQLHRDILRCNDEIIRFEEQNLPVQLSSLRETLNKKTTEKTQKEQDLKRLEEKSKILKESIANQEIQERDLQENFELKKARREQEVLQNELDNLQMNLGELDFSELMKEKEKLEKKENDLSTKKSTILGQIGQLEQQVKDLKTELKKPAYRDAYTDYLRTYKEVFVLTALIKDLTEYRIALDHALTKFHQEKMAQINENIRILWREIYRGNDIDWIEIRTEDNSTSAGTRRRNYEYRVVQCKNNTELDMRGRCSAGQKVLASLIIRLALSETFSANCGVMALDEPTTNLDIANITSLCDAIGKILVDRDRFGHFIMIIITHDETFLQTLAPHLATSYRVSRDVDGKSLVTKVN